MHACCGSGVALLRGDNGARGPASSRGQGRLHCCRPQGSQHHWRRSLLRWLLLDCRLFNPRLCRLCNWQWGSSAGPIWLGVLILPQVRDAPQVLDAVTARRRSGPAVASRRVAPLRQRRHRQALLCETEPAALKGAFSERA